MLLTNLAQQLRTSWIKRHLLFLGATFVTLLFIGYNFGTFDEAMHVPFLKASVYPGMYDGDTMIGLHSVYYSYFWIFFEPVLQAGWLELVLFVVHLASLYLSFWAIWELSLTLFDSPLASFLSVIGFIVPHFGFSGFPIFEFAPLARTFVLPFLLLALNQFLKGRVPLAFLIVGLMYNIHVVSVNFVLAMFGMACLLELKRIGVKKILLSGGLFLAAAAPVLLWKAGGDPVDFSLRPAWLAFLNQTLFFHLFNGFSFHYPGTWAITLSGLSVLVLFWLVKPQAELPQAAVTARNFFYGGVAVLLVHLVSIYFLPVTIIIQSQILRVGLWLMILTYLFIANFLAKAYQTGRFTPPLFAFLAATFLLAPSPLILLMVWAAVTWTTNPKIIKTALVLAPLFSVAAFGVVWYIGFWQPIGIFIYGERTPWVEVQQWARDNTPAEARFITPPEKWGLQESDWRVHSERASVATLSEVLMAAFQPGYETDWRARFELVAPGALEKFDGDYFNNVSLTRAAYDSLSTQDLLVVACQLDAQYAVIQNPRSHDLPVAYENTEYTVYSVSGFDCP